MTDPLADIVTLLQPDAAYSKLVSGAGRWRVGRSVDGVPFYCVILEGSCRLEMNGNAPILLQADDFVLVPELYDFATSSLEPPPPGVPNSMPVALAPGRFHVGEEGAPTDVQMLVGHCSFGSPDADLLVSLLPNLVLVRGERRLSTLVKLVREESREQRPARDLVLARLLEVLLIEALRSTNAAAETAGLVRGLADTRLSVALRQMHESPEKPWTVAQLATAAALSRSAFFDRFSRIVGVAPMEYLLSWRMALAKNMLRQKGGGVAKVAERVGYGSASAFSVAFTRYVGLPPTQYANGQAARDSA
ncbi:MULTISPECIES: AraC family transcriptional regulator [unclassified Achromobacter]|uniref:AraC family transcriptional regulator n=1 Tax=unclassified Achromobacter TaxID=2626865 RepID=UPI000B51BE92|nr:MULTISPECIES: AraC family transcriptional regulator [unclassified Achromobacter]OWT80747.1 AraC family transcriptional regulator [Achromobacter sp. HZ34]OWT81263.1 AraC family transcriptional regulator [Achromobacter sp. HZ28]